MVVNLTEHQHLKELRERLAQTQHLLEVEQQKNQAITSSLSDALIIVNLEKQITAFNKSAENLTGFSATEVINKPIDEVISIFEGENLIHSDIYCPTSGFDVDAVILDKEQLRLFGKSDLHKTVDLKSRKIRGGSTIGLGCIISIKDRTNEKQLEDMKLDFVSLSAHELRTPLTALKGFLSFLQKETTVAKLDDNEKMFLSKSVESTDRLTSLIENILLVSGISDSPLTINPTGIQIEPVISSVVQEFKQAAADKNIELKIHKPIYNLPMVNADITRLKEAVRRLLENAINYTVQGEITIDFSLNGDFVEVKITDTGKGIPQEALPHIFEKFFRVKEKELIMENVGKGIGLFICKNIIEKHKGKIWAESTLGQGSTFHFTIPVKK